MDIAICHNLRKGKCDLLLYIAVLSLLHFPTLFQVKAYPPKSKVTALLVIRKSRQPLSFILMRLKLIQAPRKACYRCSLQVQESEMWHSCLQISHQLHQRGLCNAKRTPAKLQSRNRLLQIPTQQTWEELIVLISFVPFILLVGSVESGIDTFFGFCSTYLFVILLFFLLFTVDERKQCLSFALN